MAYQKPYTPKKKVEKHTLIGTAMWANVYERNMQQEREFTRADGSTWRRPAQYSIELILSEKALEVAKKLGLEKNIRQPNDKQIANGYTGPYLSFMKSAVINGEKAKSPKVSFEMGGETTEAIGNGSTVEVVFTMKPGTNVEKYGYNLYLSEVVIRNLIPYAEKGGSTETAADTAATPETSQFDDDLPF